MDLFILNQKMNLYNPWSQDLRTCEFNDNNNNSDWNDAVIISIIDLCIRFLYILFAMYFMTKYTIELNGIPICHQRDPSVI